MNFSYKYLWLISSFLFFTIDSTVFDFNEGELGKIAKKYDCDKGYSHSYIGIYHEYFKDICHDSIKFLEIGFLQGASACMWEEYFPNAELHFLDVDHSCYKHLSKLSSRSKLHMVDQSKEEELQHFINSVGGFDIIIDDGGHTMNQQRTSFRVLFPHVKKGGVYIIEDLHTSYWKSFGGLGNPGDPKASTGSTTELLKELVDKVNYVGAFTGAANRETAKKRVKDGFDVHGKYNYPKNFFETLDYDALHIKSIHFYDSLCFIFKW